MSGAVAATATIVFTDLVGSTALRVALGEERADELRRAHDQLLGACIDANGGRVVKGGGDGLLGAFEAASAAVTAAVQMQEQIARYNARPDRLAELSVRIGLSAGDVLWEDGDCFGTPVVEAARLEAMAEGGQILCSELVRLLGRGRGGHEFVDVGSFELKGLPEPVRAYAVQWAAPPPPAGLPLPTGLGNTAGQPFVGRAAELADLSAALQETEATVPAVLWLAGEPGIGKTRLAAELAAARHGEGWSVLFGRSDEALAAPYQPFAEALRHAVTHLPPQELAGVVDGIAGELAVLCPDLAQRVPGADGAAAQTQDQYRLFEAVRQCLERLALVRPTLVVLDDVQWATTPTLLLLNYLARTAGTGRLALVATVRDTECPAGLQAIMDESRLRPRNCVVKLHGLDLDAVAELTADRAAAAAVLTRTAGNPLFLHAVLHDEQSSTIEASVRRRVGRLPADVQAVLRLAALDGLAFEHRVVALAAGFAAVPALNHLEEAVRAGLLEESGPGVFRFAHALVRDALVDEIGSTRRQLDHRALAEATEALRPDDIAGLARHWAAAAVDTASIERAARYLTLAGDAAVEATDYDGAARAFDRALELLGAADRADVAELLFKAGRARLMGGSHTEQTESLLLRAARLATSLDLQELRVDATGNAYIVRTMLGMTGSAGQAAIRSLVADPPADARLRLRAFGYFSNSLGYEGALDEAVAVGRAVLRDAAAAPDDIGIAFAHNALSLFLPIESSAEAAEHGLSAIALGPAGETLIATTWRVNVAARALACGAVARCRAQLELARAEGERLRHPFVRHAVTVTDATLAYADGRLDRCESLVIRSSEISEQLGGFDGAGMEGVQMFTLRREQGRLQEVAPTMRLLARLDRDRSSAWRPGLAALFAELGMAEEATQELRRLVDGGTIVLPEDTRLPLSLSYLVDAAAEVGDAQAARLLYERMAPWSGLWVTMFCIACYGPVDRYLGMLALTQGELDTARAHLEAALSQSRHDAALFEAQAHYWLARTARADGRTAAALEHLHEVFAIADGRSLPALHRRTEVLLARLRP